MNELFICTPRLKPPIPFFTTRSIKETEDNKTRTLRMQPKSKTLHHYELPVVRIPRIARMKIAEPKTPQARSRRPKPFKTPYVTNPPISPENALLLYKPLLTKYEREEITEFPEIYFLGRLSSKPISNNNPENNFGFDDEDRNYNVQVGDHLAYRYEVLEYFGEGAFGNVLKCYDHKTKTIVAVKAIVNDPKVIKQAHFEAKVLSILNEKCCREIIRAFDFFIFRKHPFITFEVLGEDLTDLCNSPVQIASIHNLSLQILTALDCMHQSGIVHCDIKPENIMFEINSKSLIKLIDFGSCCFAGKPVFNYIQSRHYRAPEVILGLQYGPPIDMWGFGCVLAEMMSGNILFPGEDEGDQLQLIGELLGPPPREMIIKGSRSFNFYEPDLTPKSKYPRKPASVCLSDIDETKDELLLDLLSKCLTWDPKQRITSMQALNHPFIKNNMSIFHKTLIK